MPAFSLAWRPRLDHSPASPATRRPPAPWSSGGGGSPPPLATHACIPPRMASTAGSLRRFTRHTTLPCPPHHLAGQTNLTDGDPVECHGFGGGLEPRYIG